jgi:hypothetical protein
MLQKRAHSMSIFNRELDLTATMNALAIIPVRGGSKRLPRKNIRHKTNGVLISLNVMCRKPEQRAVGDTAVK